MISLELENLGITPISEENPAGKDISYEPEFEELQSEIDKMSVVSAAGEVDWKKVVNLSTTLLSEKGKHLLVCVYLARGLMETRQVEGLIIGTQILKDLSSTFWDKLYPPKKRKRGRINALKWWYGHTENFLRSLGDAPEQKEEDIKRLKTILKELDTTLDEKLGGDAPLLRPLIQLVDRIPVKQAASPEKEQTQPQQEKPSSPKQTPERPSTSTPSPSTSVPQGGEIGSPKDANRLLSQCISTLSQIVQFYLKQDLASPISYQINRFCAWVDVDMLPVVQEENKTMLPPPDESIRSTIQGLIASREYEDAIRACEARIKEFIFWLDLSYWSAQALQELGGKYIKAYEAVAFNTSAYIQRLPGLEGLAFSDGTPFVSPETKAWLKGLTGQEDASPGASEGDSWLIEKEKEAKGLLQKKKISQAISIWQEGMQRGFGAREKFLCQIHLIKTLMAVGKKDMAIPHAMMLLDILEEYQLKRWEPELAVQGLLKVFEVLDGTKGYEEKRERIKQMLICLNPSLAIKTIG